MSRQTVLLGALCLVIVAASSASAATPPPSRSRGRGSRKAFGNRPRTSTTSFPTTPTSPSPSPAPVTVTDTFHTFSPALTTTSPFIGDVQVAGLSRAPPAPHNFGPRAAVAAPQPQTQQASALRTARGPSPQNFGPQFQFNPRHEQQNNVAPPRQNLDPRSRGAGNNVPIVALNFNLKNDGSYTTNSETGDGTVRQERGQFNGAGMAVHGMYAYRDFQQGPVQVNYVADEYGFQPQGPNIHPAILQAVAEQVQNARSAKSRGGAGGLNGVLGEDYDDGSYKPDREREEVAEPRQKPSRRIVFRRV